MSEHSKKANKITDVLVRFCDAAASGKITPTLERLNTAFQDAGVTLFSIDTHGLGPDHGDSIGPDQLSREMAPLARMLADVGICTIFFPKMMRQMTGKAACGAAAQLVCALNTMMPQFRFHVTQRRVPKGAASGTNS